MVTEIPGPLKRPIYSSSLKGRISNRKCPSRWNDDSSPSIFLSTLRPTLQSWLYLWGDETGGWAPVREGHNSHMLHLNSRWSRSRYTPTDRRCATTKTPSRGSRYQIGRKARKRSRKSVRSSLFIKANLFARAPSPTINGSQDLFAIVKWC